MSDTSPYFGVSTRVVNHAAVEGVELPFMLRITEDRERQ